MVSVLEKCLRGTPVYGENDLLGGSGGKAENVPKFVENKNAKYSVIFNRKTTQRITEFLENN